MFSCTAVAIVLFMFHNLRYDHTNATYNTYLVNSTVGGVMGYMKTGSQKSLAAGGISSLLLYYVHTQLPTNPGFASSLGLGKKILMFTPSIFHLPNHIRRRCIDSSTFQVCLLHFLQWWVLASRDQARCFRQVLYLSSLS